MLILQNDTCSSICCWTRWKDLELATSNDDTNGITFTKVDAGLDEMGVITGESPDLRASQPMVLTSLGEDWDNQPSEGFSPPEGFGLVEKVVVEDFNRDNLLDIFVPTLDQNLLFI